ncbi:MAG: hypothetical protein AVDCRST_MAG53-2281, partial [uncultured Solirubrobacteraceae bacterium]
CSLTIVMRRVRCSAQAAPGAHQTATSRKPKGSWRPARPGRPGAGCRP